MSEQISASDVAKLRERADSLAGVLETLRRARLDLVLTDDDSKVAYDLLLAELETERVVNLLRLFAIQIGLALDSEKEEVRDA